MWRKGETPVRGWWECKLVQPLWKTVWRFLKKNYHMIQQFHFWVFIQKKRNHYLEKVSEPQCSLQHYLQ